MIPQVVTGGHYDVDCRLEDPDGNVLYKEMKKQYDSFTFTASKNGTYKFCFSNEFSTFTHKTVYFDFQVGDDPPLFPNENRVTALTQVSLCVDMHSHMFSCCIVVKKGVNVILNVILTLARICLFYPGLRFDLPFQSLSTVLLDEKTSENLACLHYIFVTISRWNQLVCPSMRP